MNVCGLLSAVFSLLGFGLTLSWLRTRSLGIRSGFLASFTLHAVPGLLVALYYLHVLPEQAWFYEFRSWPGSEFSGIFIGCAAGAAAAFFPKALWVLPLAGSVTLTVIPFLKPLLWPIRESSFKDHWKGEACLQSTPSTCGPASVCTILKQLGGNPSERVIARAAFSYEGGTEAWYLARWVRGQGFAARFVMVAGGGFPDSSPLPALVGVRTGSWGHFIAVLSRSGGTITFSDPLRGQERLPLEEFQRRYEFTGFQMSVTPRLHAL